jgi:XisH protein
MARDKIHGAVKNALTKDGWTITADPFVIEFKDAELKADMAAERAIAAQRDSERIAVEVKSFLGPSPFHDLELALGQYELYRMFLEQLEPDRKVYLAVSRQIWLDFFQRESVQVVLDKSALMLVIVNVETEEVSQWIGR